MVLLMGEEQSDNSMWRDTAKAKEEANVDKSYIKLGLKLNFFSSDIQHYHTLKNYFLVH